MALDKLKIIDSIGQEFEMPKTFEIRNDPARRRSKLLPVAFNHGAKDVSDGMFASKMITVSGEIWAESDAAFNVKWDALAEHIVKDDIRIQNRGRQIYLKKIAGVSVTYPSTALNHVGKVSITFVAADPFWYSAASVQKQKVVTASPDSFQHDVDGLMETWPIITIVNTNDNFDFTLKNETDDDRELQIIDVAADAGTTIYIDCKNGTVLRGTTDIISKFSGMFLRLLGGRTNEFTYTGADCVITMDYYLSWI